MGCGEDGKKGLNLNTNSGSTDNSTPLLQEPAPGTISQATFNKIKEGMTYSEVEKLIGSPEATDIKSGLTTVRWTNKSPNFGMVVVTFKDDKVVNTLGLSLK